VRKINASSPKVSYYFGLSLKTLGQYDNALKYLKRVVTKFPRDLIARNERGRLYLLMKDYPRAIADFEKVLGIDPENVEAYFHLKNAYGAVGEEEKARNAANLYERFRASESSFLNNVPTDSLSSVRRERQPIHEHISAPLVDIRTISAATNGNAQTAGQ
jgi:tetratricopeptide (TPR) repeat protein